MLFLARPGKLEDSFCHDDSVHFMPRALTSVLDGYDLSVLVVNFDTNIIIHREACVNQFPRVY